MFCSDGVKSVDVFRRKRVSSLETSMRRVGRMLLESPSSPLHEGCPLQHYSHIVSADALLRLDAESQTPFECCPVKSDKTTWPEYLGLVEKALPKRAC